MFDKFEPKKERNKDKKNEKLNVFSMPGLSENQINKFSGNDTKRLAPPPPAIRDFDKRMTDLELKGKKRGRRNMFIGTIGGAIIALIVMGLVYYLSQDISKISDKIEQNQLDFVAHKCCLYCK